MEIQGHLAGVSQSEWEAIPDVGDYSLKYKQSKRREIFTPMPDHVIEGARNDSAVSDGGGVNRVRWSWILLDDA